MSAAPRGYALSARLALLGALLFCAVMGTAGFALCQMLAQQLSQRDDAALVARADQLRTLLRDGNALALIHDKPHLFANMLDNREGMLVLRRPGQAPLIEINPSHWSLPAPPALAPESSIPLSAVRHGETPDGLPYGVVAVLARTGDAAGPLEIVAGRVMGERARLLQAYRLRVWLLVLAGAALFGGLGLLLIRRAMAPLRQLAAHAQAVNVSNLDPRLASADAPHELLPLIQAFNAMLDRLAAGFGQLSQVTSDLAHDLRTPINNLLGQTQVALGQPRSVQEYEELLASNVEEFERLTRMADNMLFLARSQNPQDALDLQPLQLEAELRRVADYFEGPALDRALGIEAAGSGTLRADAELLRRALANLLANAVRHAEPGSAITLSARQEGRAIVIDVENRGADIAPEHQARIFDRFYRADAARAGSTQSSGLGLSIVRAIMELHGGGCRVSSAGGVTRFSLRFPAD